MVKHNNALVKNHFRKDWERHVKTWFQQPARKIKRKQKRQARAAKIFPRPTELLRPLVHCQTQRYNSKIRLGRGFTVDELRLAKLDVIQAKSVGIAVDFRRKNRSLETQRSNVQRLQLYKSKVVVFPRKRKQVKSQKKDKAAAPEQPTTKKQPKPQRSLKLFSIGSVKDEEKVQQLNAQFPFEYPKTHEPPRAITQYEKDQSAFLTLRKAHRQAKKVGNKIRKERKAALGVPATAKVGGKAKDDAGDDDEEGGKGKGKGGGGKGGGAKGKKSDCNHESRRNRYILFGFYIVWLL
jgi:large subunit ribosomal protein L13e